MKEGAACRATDEPKLCTRRGLLLAALDDNYKRAAAAGSGIVVGFTRTCRPFFDRFIVCRRLCHRSSSSAFSCLVKGLFLVYFLPLLLLLRLPALVAGCFGSDGGVGGSADGVSVGPVKSTFQYATSAIQARASVCPEAHSDVPTTLACQRASF